MDQKKMDEYKAILLQLKSQILNGGILTSSSDLTISQDDLADEADLANSVINQQVTFNIRQRELSKLRSVEEALDRIEKKTYGYCEECDEEIPDKRLKNQPWSSLCIEHAEEKEREDKLFAKTA